MSEYLHVEKPFLDQLSVLGWKVVDQGQGFIPSDPATSLRGSFREWMLPEVFREAVRAINRTADGTVWLTDRQLDDLRDQILRQPNRTLLEANEAVQALFLKAQVDRNEVTGESDPMVSLIDFAYPERNVFHAINQFRIDTPGCVKQCIIPDIVLFVNGIPLVVVEAKIGDANTAINEHLIDLGINPRIPPTELLADDFIANVQKHAQGDPEAKASEMEHAIRKHCTVHFDEDPAFYKRLSEKLEKLIQAHQNNWQELADGDEQIRNEAMAGRTDAIEGLSKEATTFYDYVVQLAFEGGNVPGDSEASLKKLMARIVETMQGTIDIIDFWRKPIEVKRLRGDIDTEILLANIPQLTGRHERIAVEIVKLAEKRHEELTK